MIEFTRVSLGNVCSAIVNQARKIAFVLFFLALVMTIQPPSVNATTLSPLGSVGLKHQAQGAIDKATGKAETKLNQAKGMAREVKGNVTGNIGRVESKAEGLRNKTDDAVDDGKNMLDDLGDKIQSTANGIADSVKDLAK
jgi:uncharacterized protein YjbJ (UPF0337 family)